MPQQTGERSTAVMLSKVRLPVEVGKLCGRRGNTPRQTSRGWGRINPAAAKDTLHQMNVKGFASRPNGSSNEASRLLLELLPKSGPTLDIPLVPRGWPLTGLMLTDQCSRSIRQTRGSDLLVQRSSGRFSQLRRIGFIYAEDEPVEQRRIPRLVRAKEYVPGGGRNPRRGWLARKKSSRRRRGCSLSLTSPFIGHGPPDGGPVAQPG